MITDSLKRSVCSLHWRKQRLRVRAHAEAQFHDAEFQRICPRTVRKDWHWANCITSFIWSVSVSISGASRGTLSLFFFKDKAAKQHSDLWLNSDIKDDYCISLILFKRVTLQANDVRPSSTHKIDFQFLPALKNSSFYSIIEQTEDRDQRIWRASA